MVEHNKIKADEISSAFILLCSILGSLFPESYFN